MTDISPVSDANPQVTEEAGSPVTAVGFPRPFVSPKLLELAQAVRQQHVGQLLLPEAREAVRLFQLHLHLWWTGHPGGGRHRAQLKTVLTGLCCGLKSLWWTPGARKADREKTR